MLSAVRLVCHSLAFADPDVCGGGGKGVGQGVRTSLENHNIGPPQ